MMKVNQITDHTWPENNQQGACVTFTDVIGNVIVIQIADRKEAFATILHESVHVWQSIMDYIQEPNPGIETEAYTIEYIVTTLMQQYQELTGEKLAVPNKRKARLQKGTGVGTSSPEQSPRPSKKKRCEETS